MSFSLSKNKRANSWMGAHNLYYVPTIYWDGGYRVKVGTSGYTTDINTCKNRAVADLDATAKVEWLGNGDMKIDVSVKNNDPTNFSGYLRVYVAEKLSSYNWRDSSGVLYSYPFLDFAANKSIQIAAGQTHSETISWIGSQHNNGYGVNFSTTQQNNIRVFVAVCDGTPHTKYSKPPNGSPFNAYYVEELTYADPDPPKPLKADTDEISQGSGGVVNFTLEAGGSNYWRSYTILAGMTGTSPGTPLAPGVILPLNWDIFTNIGIQLINSSIFHKFNGKLDHYGKTAAPKFDVPFAMPSSMLGQNLQFAAFLYYPFDWVSNAVTIEVVP